MPETGLQVPLTRRAAAVVAVAATYFYFLLFSEFAFLELVLALPEGGRLQQPVMGTLGAGGLLGSVLAARFFRAERFGGQLAALFLLCAVAAFLSLGLGHGLSPYPVAGLLGLCLGAQTVLLASGLRAALGLRRLGFHIGLGTGLAYGLCNVPWVFQAPAPLQAILAGLVALFGAVGAFMLGVLPGAEPSRESDYTLKGFLPWLLAFTALVWLDSAAFFIIQHSAALKGATWSGDSMLWGNAAVHASVAVLAGWLLDRGRGIGVLAAAFLLLSAACVVLSLAPGWSLSARTLYTAGVSLYSVALVYLAARGGRPWLVALLFGVAGWFGSAMGIGMAQNLRAVPPWFLLLAGAGLVLALLSRRRSLGRVAAVLLCLGFADRSLEAQPSPEEMGKRVFIAEGCIHCHSQYLRPISRTDRERWGASQPLAESLKQTPPLYGNRRQGPDLSTVGARRSYEWQVLHLQNPRALRPGSRMPSYARLFEAGDERGEALVRYLCSLGADKQEELLARSAAWVPADKSLGSEAGGRKLFMAWCVPCHGPEGRGDGPLAAQLGVKAPDFHAGTWRRLPQPVDAVAVARVIKFGLVGSSMAGFEFLQDEELLSLARFVLALHGSSSGVPAAAAR